MRDNMRQSRGVSFISSFLLYENSLVFIICLLLVCQHQHLNYVASCRCRFLVFTLSDSKDCNFNCFFTVSKGCGFVKYARRDMALAAISALNGIYTMRVKKMLFVLNMQSFYLFVDIHSCYASWV